MDVRTYLRAVRKSWWLILVAVVAGAAAAYAYAATSTPVYAATVQFTVGISQSGSAANPESNTQYAQDNAVTLAKLLSSDRAARNIIAATGVDLTEGALAQHISGEAEINTTVIDATVTDTSLSRLRVVARGLASTFPDMAATVQSPGTGGTQLRLSVTSGPTVGTAPVSPRTKLDVAVGVVLGLILGLLIAVLRLLRDTSVRTREDAESISGAPLVGDIAFDSAARTAPLVLERQSRSVRAEAFRQIRTNLQFIDAASSLRVLLVTSSTEAEGKSTTATNLALTFAESGRRVLLVGADLRRPKVADYLGLEPAIGLTNVLVGQVDLDTAVQPFGEDGLSVLASGSIPPNPSELLGSVQMGQLVARLRARYDQVIIDTPPLLPVTDAAVLAVHADGVVLVCRAGRTRRAQLATAVRALRTVNARVVGVVLNMRSAGGDSGHYGTYSYYTEGHRGWRARLTHWRHHRATGRPEPLPVPDLPVSALLTGAAGPVPAAGGLDFGREEVAPYGAGRHSVPGDDAYARRRKRREARAAAR